MNLEEVVRQTVRQIVTKLYEQGTLSAAAANADARVLALLPEGEHPHLPAAERLLEEASRHYQVTVCRCGERAGQLHLVQQSDIVAVPILTMGWLSKTALLLDDEAMPAMIVSALTSAKPVVISTSALFPAGAGKLLVPAAIEQTAGRYIQTLIRYGAHMTVTKRLLVVMREIAANLSSPRAVVHSRHVREWAAEGETSIELPATTIVTAMAREDATDLGLKLNIRPTGKEDGDEHL